MKCLQTTGSKYRLAPGEISEIQENKLLLALVCSDCFQIHMFWSGATNSLVI